jgi:ferrous iron transport protein A
VVRGIDVANQEGGIEAAELERRLLEMGFVEGAQIQVLHEGLFGRDPMAVRLDDMRVALRRREAAAILVDLPAAAE